MQSWARRLLEAHMAELVERVPIRRRWTETMREPGRQQVRLDRGQGRAEPRQKTSSSAYARRFQGAAHKGADGSGWLVGCQERRSRAESRASRMRQSAMHVPRLLAANAGRHDRVHRVHQPVPASPSQPQPAQPLALHRGRTEGRARVAWLPDPRP